MRPFQYDPPELGPRDVEIKIAHCGFCHSDLDLINNEWGMSVYPMVPGHEVIGHVSGLGTNVKNLNLGQRVGVGWQAGACLECDYCLRGAENICHYAYPEEAANNLVSYPYHDPGRFVVRVRSEGRTFPVDLIHQFLHAARSSSPALILRKW